MLIFAKTSWIYIRERKILAYTNDITQQFMTGYDLWHTNYDRLWFMPTLWSLADIFFETCAFLYINFVKICLTIDKTFFIGNQIAFLKFMVIYIRFSKINVLWLSQECANVMLPYPQCKKDQTFLFRKTIIFWILCEYVILYYYKRIICSKLYI